MFVSVANRRKCLSTFRRGKTRLMPLTPTRNRVASGVQGIMPLDVRVLLSVVGIGLRLSTAHRPVACSGRVGFAEPARFLVYESVAGCRYESVAPRRY